MCGIAGIILKNKQTFNVIEKTIQLSEAIKHRGPDGEGFLVISADKIIPCSNSTIYNNLNSEIKYLPNQHINSIQNKEAINITFAHRRLSIIDLKLTGHQPLCDVNQNYWITYNGEIYNYIELREELKQVGYRFVSETDTEVVLAAYAHWGFECVNKFNGMWAFCIYDTIKQICFASRDRLGVKPFYFINSNDYFSFASEQKAFIKAELIQAKTSEKVLKNYLLNSLLETETSNFFEGVTELWPGTNLIYNLKTHQIEVYEYFNLKTQITLENNHLSDKEIIDKIHSLLERAIQLRLRSDVEVGTCLSGGIDSSVIATIISSLTQNKLFCFTSVFRNNKINEEHFADLVTNKINSKSIKIEPTLDGFLSEVDALIYSQDAPIWNTSTYAQYKVMELAKQNNIKVVLDGQGADELFGGYHHHFMAKWQSLISQSKTIEAFKDINSSSKTIKQPFFFFTKEIIKQRININYKYQSKILKKDFLINHDNTIATTNQKNLNEVLIDDIYKTRLKTFLKCEDRCGMWHSVESRTPFSDDIDLINFLFSFDGNRKIQKGISKYLLREATKQYLPNEIYSRYDKIGFETPMQDWMIKIRPQILNEIKSAGFNFVNYNILDNTNPNNELQNKLLFKLFVLSRWKKVFNK